MQDYRYCSTDFVLLTLISTWGNNYITNIKPLITLQKKVVRVKTFSDYRAHTSHFEKW